MGTQDHAAFYKGMIVHIIVVMYKILFLVRELSQVTRITSAPREAADKVPSLSTSSSRSRKIESFSLKGSARSLGKRTSLLPRSGKYD